MREKPWNRVKRISKRLTSFQQKAIHLLQFEKNIGSPVSKEHLLAPDYDETVHLSKQRYLFYFGDEHGYLKVWDLTYLLQQSGIQPCTISHPKMMGHSFKPHRIEAIQIEKNFAFSVRKEAIKRSKGAPTLQNPTF